MSEAPEKNLEQLKAAVDFAKQAISYAFLLNGGALIGMMTFMGNAIDKLPPEKFAALAGSSGFFIAGLVVSAICSVLAYITQLGYFKKDSGISGAATNPSGLRVLLIILMLVSILSFAFGASDAFKAMTA